MPIQILPARLANQIAAGEVVERPASVIKELVENSIDAQATQINIEVEKGGHKRILIRDDGKGIAKDELGLALSRHATSKIKDIDDLEAITSLGFRGEALASISSVSRLVLTSKPESQEQAWQAHCEGRDMEIQLNPTAHPKGSSVEVLDLFFNTPARRKFLRAEKTEFQHVEEVVKRIALSHPQIAFSLKHNGKLIHKFAKVDASLLRRRVAQVCGQAFIDKSAEIDTEYQNIRIKGYCSTIGQGHKTNDMQYSFINGRMMKDRVILHAIRQAFEGMIDEQSYPAFALFIEMPPDQLDVNVHPAKHEVRFHQSRLVHDLIFKSISEAILRAAPDDAPQPTDFSKSAHGYAQDTDLQNAHFPLQQSEPTRDYVSSLQTQSRTSTYSGGKTNNQLSQYMPQRPSQTEVSAYGQLMASSHQESGAETWLTAKLQTLLTPDKQVILSANGVLKYAPLSVVGAVYLERLIEQSSVTQPLLMPVSVACNNVGISQVFANASLEVSVNNKKIILKRVPSALRQLPWLHIFPTLVKYLEEIEISTFSEAGKNDELVHTMLQIAVDSWSESVPLGLSELNHWLISIGDSALNQLFEHAISFELPSKNNAANKKG
ncbi:DNA mismatch repair endonuclease MutL [Glaciecola sp. KUL10]|uniref:DNA mismatch repair endonuclease MutL n=1 Tax=Glaciecola sp. (strain KUL10) TaxID=2161813 RepID=UPI000D782C94|nr:DNA mismatch repair endonuclease MutL [Glaciecola sp. KUL10]GBL04624.1 DNA mismatch repair protein MutL [Glaciecola sp. KUL10]